MDDEKFNALIEEAKSKYLPGTIFDSLGGNNNVEVLKTDIFRERYEHKGEVGVYSKSNAYKGFVVCIKNTTRWAKIVRHAVPQITNTYEIY